MDALLMPHITRAYRGRFFYQHPRDYLRNPSNISSKQANNTISLVESNNNKNAQSNQLVVMFGWTGCRKRWLNRYEKLYLDRNYQVLSIIPRDMEKYP